MTDLQVRFQTLQETKRANKAQEELKGREVFLKEEIQPAEVQLKNAQIVKTNAETEKILAEVPKIAAQIEQIKADTSLTETEKMDKLYRLFRQVGIDLSSLASQWGIGTPYQKTTGLLDNLTKWIGNLGGLKGIAGFLV